MSVRVIVRMSKMMCTLIEVGVCVLDVSQLLNPVSH